LEKRLFTYVTLALLVWGILGSATAGYYLTQYTTYRNEYKNLLGDLNVLSNALGNFSAVMNTISLRANILLSYGNGTRTWFNDTALPIGSTAFTAILAISDVKYKDYGGTLGILVTSVNGVGSPDDFTHGWFFWYEATENSTWEPASSSCANYILHRGDTIAFSYESSSPWPTSPS
jgi:hypothetical protein